MDAHTSKKSIEAETSTIEKTGPIQLETASVSSHMKEEVRQVTDLTAKEQYRKL